MTHTALTADEEIRRIRGLATARKEPPVRREDYRETPMFWEHHLESAVRHGLAEALACRNVPAPAPPQPTPAARVWTWLTALGGLLGRSPGNVVGNQSTQRP